MQKEPINQIQMSEIENNTRTATAAEAVFVEIVHGRLNAIALPSPYIELSNSHELKVGDVLEFNCDDTGEVVQTKVEMLLEHKGDYIISFKKMARQQVFRVEGIPKISVNQLYSKSHWGFRKNAKDIMTTRVWEAFGRFRISFICAVQYDFFFPASPLDPTNCFGMIKMIEDIIFVQDTYKDVTFLGVTSDKGAKGSSNTVVITVTY